MASRLPGHSSGEVFAGDGAGLRSGGGLVGGNARRLIQDGAGSNGDSWSGGMLRLNSDDGAGGRADSRSVVGESGSAMVRLSVFAVFGSNSGTVLFAGSSCDCSAGNKCCPGLSGRSDQDGLFALLNG